MENSLRTQDTTQQKKIIKYILFGLIIGISIRYIPSKPIENNEILMIAAISAITFAIIDMIAPSITVK